MYKAILCKEILHHGLHTLASSDPIKSFATIGHRIFNGNCPCPTFLC